LTGKPAAKEDVDALKVKTNTATTKNKVRLFIINIASGEHMTFMLFLTAACFIFSHDVSPG
jgi:hypothetical protein